MIQLRGKMSLGRWSFHTDIDLSKGHINIWTEETSPGDTPQETTGDTQPLDIQRGESSFRPLWMKGWYFGKRDTLTISQRVQRLKKSLIQKGYLRDTSSTTTTSPNTSKPSFSPKDSFTQ